MTEENGCEHLTVWKELKSSTGYFCAECVKTGGHWVHLRTCQTCGVTLCCDSSPNQHASRHAIQFNHPLAISAEPGERWIWCYIHKLFSGY